MKKGLLILALISLIILSVLTVKMILNEEPNNSGVSGQLADGKNPEETVLSFSDLSEYPFLFTSGAGGWGTRLSIEADGSFYGEYHDSEFGLSGIDYDGSTYISKFKGTFSPLVKIDEKTYSMKVVSITTENEPDTEEILDGMRYIYTLPFGVELGKEFKVHLPDIDVSKLGDEFKKQAKGSFYFEGDILPVMALESEISESESYNIAVFTKQQ